MKARFSTAQFGRFLSSGRMGKSKSKGNKKLDVEKQSYVTQIDNNCVRVNVFAKPGSKVNLLKGVDEGRLSIDINAPAVDGKANAELCLFVAAVLGIHKRDVTLIQGQKSRNKVLKVQLSEKLSGLLDVEKKLHDALE